MKKPGISKLTVTKRRSQEERSADARKRIVAAAEYCFRQYGYHRTSMSQIARSAKVSRALLHYHFENQEKLTLAVWEGVAAGIFDRMITMAPAAKNTEEWISALYDRLWLELRGQSQLVAVAVDVALRAGAKPKARARFRAHLDSHAKLIEQGIALLVPSSIGPLPIEARTIADMILVVCTGVAALSPILDSEGSYERTDVAVAAFKTLFMTQLFSHTQAHAA